MKVIIRAGGVGTRLWPVSLKSKPKQLHALVSKKTLLQETWERVVPIVSPENIFISCNRSYEKAIRKQLKGIHRNHLIIEPERRDTAAAICWESLVISKKDTHAIVASLGSDHVVHEAEVFQKALQRGEAFLQKYPEHILLLACKPSYPDTGYGYIQFGSEKEDGIFQVKEFREKPNEKDAKKYFESGKYLWNANMFMWRVDTVLQLYAKNLPQMFRSLSKANAKNLSRIYSSLPSLSIDTAILEKAKNIVVMPLELGWSDIGDWARLKDQLASQEVENVLKGKVSVLDSKNSLVWNESKKVTAAIGLKDIIVVVTDQAVLVCDKYSSQKVKEVLVKLDPKFL